MRLEDELTALGNEGFKYFGIVRKSGIQPVSVHAQDWQATFGDDITLREMHDILRAGVTGENIHVKVEIIGPFEPDLNREIAAQGRRSARKLSGDKRNDALENIQRQEESGRLPLVAVRVFEGDMIVATSSFHFNLQKHTIIAETSLTKKSHQGKGLTRQIVSNVVALCDRLNVHTMTAEFITGDINIQMRGGDGNMYHAVIKGESGLYALARMGMLVEDWDQLRPYLVAGFKRFISQLTMKGHQDVVGAVEKILASSDKRGVWALADMSLPISDGGLPSTLGKAILLKHECKGRMDLTPGSECRTRLETYLTQSHAKAVEEGLLIRGTTRSI